VAFVNFVVVLSNLGQMAASIIDLLPQPNGRAVSLLSRLAGGVFLFSALLLFVRKFATFLEHSIQLPRNHSLRYDPRHDGKRRYGGKLLKYSLIAPLTPPCLEIGNSETWKTRFPLSMHP